MSRAGLSQCVRWHVMTGTFSCTYISYTGIASLAEYSHCLHSLDKMLPRVIILDSQSHELSFWR